VRLGHLLEDRQRIDVRTRPEAASSRRWEKSEMGVTADPTWLRLSVDVEIEVVR
jgi:hypothetical protein